MDTVSWVVLAGIGFCVMRAIPHVHAKLEPWLERAGALLFLGAGTIGASGWLGDGIDWAVGWLPELLNSWSNQIAGTAVTGVLALAAAVFWLGAFLPAKWVKWGYPDWLIISGFVLPIFIGLIPGKIGDALGHLADLGGNAAVNAVASLVG